MHLLDLLAPSTSSSTSSSTSPSTSQSNDQSTPAADVDSSLRQLGLFFSPACRRSLRRLSLALLCLCAIGQPLAFANSASEPVTVNVNKADAATLADVLVGIGLRRAEAIVAYRKEHGAFQDAYELTAIKGVGERIVAENESRILLQD